MDSQGGVRLGLRAAAKIAAAACVTVALVLPANAQFWGNWGGGRPQRPPQGYQPFGGWFGIGPPQREAPSDQSRAPASQRKSDPAAAIPVVVVGDAMADWLAYGLEEALSEKPEFSIVRKHRTTSGLIRYDTRRDVEWPQVVKEIIAADKPKFIVMMVGVYDRQAIRDRTPQTRQNAAAGKQAPAPRPAPPPDPELQAQQSADQQNAEMREQQPPEAQPEEPPPIAVPEQGRGASATGPMEFRTERWEAAYIKRIDATIAALKSAGVPVFWVGLPPQRASRASTDSSYLNELYRQRAEKAGIAYVDVWDGFVDTTGQFTAQGPDFEGQIRRLRSGDGVYFTKAGARKLAHYVEREIQRTITNRVLPVALPSLEPAPAPAPATPRPGTPTQRPLAGPVVPLTASTAGANELLGGGPTRSPAADPVATRVLVRGEPVPMASGRADDFSWPRGNAATADPPPMSLSEPTMAEPAKGQPAAGSKAGEQKQPAQKRQVTPQGAPRPSGAIRPSASAPTRSWWR
jgi:uncharacterized protein